MTFAKDMWLWVIIKISQKKQRQQQNRLLLM